MLVTKSEAARALNITPQAMTRAIREGRIKTKAAANGRDMIELEGLRERWALTTQTKINGARMVDEPPRRPSTEEVPDYNESRARTEFLKAELLELERAEKEKRLVDAVEISQKWGEVVAIARTKILGIPSKAKQRIPDFPEDAFVILEDIVRESLEDLADG
jgi:phage terminase Nu1 subunit (DNA packaging protein)